MKLALTITFASLLSGCAVESDDIEQTPSFPEGVEVVVLEPSDIVEVDQPGFYAQRELPRDEIEVVVEDEPHRLPNRFEPADELEAVQVDSSPCNCYSTKCLEQWIKRHLGCDVCAVFECSEGYVPTACNVCQE